MLLAALFYGVVAALLGLTAGLAQSLAKVSLDATIQRDVPDPRPGPAPSPAATPRCSWRGCSAGSSASSFPFSSSDSTLIIPADAHDKSWLYAYDVVSQSRKNYTVRYDNDPMFLKSKNVILASDPGSSSSEKFSSGASNRWEVLRGNWNFSSKGLIVEDSSDSLQNVILSQSRYAANNLSIGTSFKSMKIDPQNHKLCIYSLFLVRS